MAEETPPVDEMHYEQLAQDALRGVIRSALERAALPDGIPGAHHFYVTFKTRAPGVSVPPDILGGGWSGSQRRLGIRSSTAFSATSISWRDRCCPRQACGPAPAPKP